MPANNDTLIEQAREFWAKFWPDQEEAFYCCGDIPLRLVEFHRSLNDWRVIEVDGLPDEERDYLVTASNGDYFVAVATFENGTFLYGDVVAWRELPAPYQPQGEGKDAE